MNRSEPDLVIFGGDFLDNYARDRETLDLEYIGAELSKIEAAYGKFAVWGNHDYGGGAVRVYKDLMEDGGFQVLENESCLIEELNVKGLYTKEEIGTKSPLQMFVSSGIGTTLYPIRFLNVPEIVEIHLKTK